jgi:hypothetical protein
MNEVQGSAADPFAWFVYFAVEIIFRLAGSWQTATVFASPHPCSSVVEFSLLCALASLR